MDIGTTAEYTSRLLIFILSTLILLFLFPTITYGSLSGSFKNDLFLNAGTSSLITYESELDITYRLEGMVFASNSVFHEDSYHSQQFGVDFGLGALDINSSLSFDPANTRMNYLLAGAGTSLGGVGIDNTLLLEHVDEQTGYGAGYKLTLRTRLPSGPGMYVKNLFGMEENEAALLGLVEGSGYTIVTNGGPSGLQYVNTTVEITDLSFDCCDFISTTKFSSQEGFEHTTLEFDLNSTNLPLKLEGKLKFTPQTKSVELNPGIDLDWACFEVYTELTTADDQNHLTGGEGGVSALGGLRIKGFGITKVDLGNLHLSSLTALHENLFRLSTEKNIDLHANDYVLSPDPVYSGLYTETDYDEVISIVSDFETIPLSIGLDTYFNLTDDNLFGFGLFTGTGRYRISNQFNLSVGLEVNPDSLEQVRLGFDYYF